MNFEFCKFVGDGNSSWNLWISGLIAQSCGELADECIDIAIMG
jgi:hypothetical protein